MTIKDLFQKYINKEASLAETIGALTGIIDPEQAVNIIAMVNQLSRVELGTMDRETFISVYGLEKSEDEGENTNMLMLHVCKFPDCELGVGTVSGKPVDYCDEHRYSTLTVKETEE